MTNVVLDIDDAAGRRPPAPRTWCSSRWEAEPLQPIITGRYHDTFERHDGRWHFAERRFFVDLVGDLSQHLAYALG